MLQNTANKIIAELKQNQAKLKANPKISYNVVTKYLLPLVDQQAMAQAVLGRNAWNKATASQRSQFIAEFRTLVVRTYASAFSQFNNEAVKFKPLRGNISGSIVQVQSVIVSSARPAINVNYNLVQKGGSWKVIDFSVDGISMINSFQSQFAGILANQGISGLITTIAKHNQKS
jgi:phospholipid transport system substrate-binding protein